MLSLLHWYYNFLIKKKTIVRWYARNYQSSTRQPSRAASSWEFFCKIFIWFGELMHKSIIWQEKLLFIAQVSAYQTHVRYDYHISQDRPTKYMSVQFKSGDLATVTKNIEQHCQSHSYWHDNVNKWLLKIQCTRPQSHAFWCSECCFMLLSKVSCWWFLNKICK